MMKSVQHMGRDQYGNTFHGLGAHPRKALLARFGRTRAEKMYVDGADGRAKHVGYVIAGHWISVYRVMPMHLQ